MAGDHVCPVCKATFTRPQHVARHMRSHTGDRPYKCQTCGDQFARSDLLSRHVNKCHSSPKTGTAPPRGSRSAANDTRIACDACNELKVRCDFGYPCARCTMKNKPCTYPQAAQASRRRRGSIVSSLSSIGGSADGSRPSTAGSIADGVLPMSHVVPTQPLADNFVHAWSNMGYESQLHNPHLRPLTLSADGGAFYAPGSALLQFHDSRFSSSPTSASDSVESSPVDLGMRGSGAYRNNNASADMLRRAAVLNPSNQSLPAGIQSSYNAWQQSQPTQHKHSRSEDVLGYPNVPFPSQHLSGHSPSNVNNMDVAFLMSQNQSQHPHPIPLGLPPGDPLSQIAFMHARQRVPSIASDDFSSSNSTSNSASSSYVQNYPASEASFPPSAPGNYSTSSLTGAVPMQMGNDGRIYHAFHGMSLDDMVAAAGKDRISLPVAGLHDPSSRPGMTREPTFTQMREMWAAYVSEPFSGGDGENGKTPGQNQMFNFGNNPRSPGHGLGKRNSMPCLKTPRGDYSPAGLTQHDVAAASGTSQVTPRAVSADSNTGRLGHPARPSTGNSQSRFIPHPTISAEDAESLRSYQAACMGRTLPKLQAPRPKTRASTTVALEMQAAAAWQEQAGYLSGPSSAPPVSGSHHNFPPMSHSNANSPSMSYTDEASPGSKKSSSPPSTRPSYKRLPSQVLGPEMHKRPQRDVPGSNCEIVDGEMVWEEYDEEDGAEGDHSDGGYSQHPNSQQGRAEIRMIPSTSSSPAIHQSPAMSASRAAAAAMAGQ